jgi:hypothetical protein
MIRKYLMLCLIINCAHFGLFAQSSESEISAEFYKADAQLSLVLHYLPNNWNFSAKDSTFFIRCIDTIWILDENRINAPVEKKDDQNARIIKEGHWAFPEIQFTYVKRWSAEQVQTAKITNSAIDNDIRALPEKYHITHLQHPGGRSKGENIYIATNEKEQQLIDQYTIEVEKLQTMKEVLPNFHTEYYSLYIKKVTGALDELHLVYPSSLSLQLYTILGTFREVCGK